MSIFRKFAAATTAMGLCLMATGSAVAAGGRWDDSQKHYNVYSTTRELVSGQFFMPPTYVDRFDMATRVQATVSAYNQSNPEEVRLCYTEPYGTKIVACTPYQKIKVTAYIEGIGHFHVVGSNEEEINGGLYENISAKGSFTIQHMFPEGSSQAIFNDGGVDSLVVYY